MELLTILKDRILIAASIGIGIMTVILILAVVYDNQPSHTDSLSNKDSKVHAPKADEPMLNLPSH
ncbi:MAG: hypothetical protein JKY52_15195 [Flavobacteriales bacterium]|nr:hypothetical protein [Flavobacteriales bacterium]